MERKGLKEAIRRLRGPAKRRVEMTTVMPFEALIQQRIGELEKQIEELKFRVNGLLFTIVGAVAINVVLGVVK